MDSWISILSILLIGNIKNCDSQFLYCNTSFECSGQTITSFNNLVEARGYKSMSNSSIANAAKIDCSGAYGCYDAKQLKVLNSLTVSGSNGAQNVERIKSDLGVSCSASNACQNSKIDRDACYSMFWRSIMCANKYHCTSTNTCIWCIFFI